MGVLFGSLKMYLAVGANSLVVSAPTYSATAHTAIYIYKVHDLQRKYKKYFFELHFKKIKIFLKTTME